MKKYLVIATHWDEEQKEQVEYIAGEFSRFVNAGIFRDAYNAYFKNKARIEEVNC